MSTINVDMVHAVSLFDTKAFRESEWVAEQCKDVQVCVTDDPVPPGHFGTYFGALTRRRYRNPYIGDLYHLHEIVHVRTMTYDPGASWLDWSRKMIRSEFEASIATECTAYLRIPGLREKTFPHEIWIDRFLKEQYRIDAELEDRVRRERVRALNAPQFDDFLEHQIWNYCHQNVQWCRIWATEVGFGKHASVPAFRAVEKHMADPEWALDHGTWLEEVTDQDNHVRVPFLRQADAFASVYKRSNEEFGNGVLVR